MFWLGNNKMSVTTTSVASDAGQSLKQLLMLMHCHSRKQSRHGTPNKHVAALAPTFWLGTKKMSITTTSVASDSGQSLKHLLMLIHTGCGHQFRWRRWIVDCGSERSSQRRGTVDWRSWHCESGPGFPLAPSALIQ